MHHETSADLHSHPSGVRLLAHYLLGRAYHDHGEAPMALQCYQDALDCADTLSTDCDYPQLARVYGQMAQIFYEQGLYCAQTVQQALKSGGLNPGNGVRPKTKIYPSIVKNNKGAQILIYNPQLPPKKW